MSSHTYPSVMLKIARPRHSTYIRLVKINLTARGSKAFMVSLPVNVAIMQGGHDTQRRITRIIYIVWFLFSDHYDSLRCGFFAFRKSV